MYLLDFYLQLYYTVFCKRCTYEKSKKPNIKDKNGKYIKNGTNKYL